MVNVKNDVAKGDLSLRTGNEIIGFITYTYRADEQTLELLRMFINFEYRHKKYASILIREIITYAQKIEAKFITLNIDPELDDCYYTITREKGFESNYDNVLIDMEEDERDKFLEKARKLMETRKYVLSHLFEKFGFNVWDQDRDKDEKKKRNSDSQWYILRL